MNKMVLGFAVMLAWSAGGVGCKDKPAAPVEARLEEKRNATTETQRHRDLREKRTNEKRETGVSGTPFVAASGLKCAAAIDPASIPAKPVEGEVNGAKFTPASGGFWAEGSFGGSSLMFRTPLGKEAGCDRFFAETRVEVTVDPAAATALGKPVTAAKNANYMVKKDDGTPVSSNAEMGVFVQVDSIEKKRGGKVKGKVAICFKDEKKSWIAGTFEADWCE